MKKAVAILLTFAMTFALFACTGKEEKGEGNDLVSINEYDEAYAPSVFESVVEKTTEVILTSLCSVPTSELRSDYFEEYVTPSKLPPASQTAANLTADFGFRIFGKAYNMQENALVSPVSIILALCLAAEGADGETLSQMESILGTDIESLRSVFGGYIANQADNKELTIANSVWLNNQKNRLSVKNDFLKVCRESYDAEIFSESFDNETLKKINNWISEKTDGAIKDVLSEIPPHAVLYLINTVLFEAEWNIPYTEYNLTENVDFKNSDGSVSKVTMMYSEESDYFTLGKTQGIVKDYSGANYAFVAMLPNEGVSIGEALASINAEDFRTQVTSPSYESVKVRLPKFEFECEFALPEILKSMGMTNAFNSSKADLSKMGTSSYGNLYIDSVLHKTYIKVAERGTKAGAATVIMVGDCAAPLEQIELTFDRPFIYAIIEKESGMPIFLGTVTNFN